MKTKIALAVGLCFVTGLAFANDCTPGTVDSLKPHCQRPRARPVQPVQTINNYPTAVAGASATGGAGGNAAMDVRVGAEIVNAPGAVTTPITFETPRQAPQAPDVISYPTAPCRVAVGGSGSWLIGSAGITFSVEDASCTLRENARQLHNQGHQSAATQILCLNDDMRMALEATGTKCLVARPPKQEAVQP